MFSDKFVFILLILILLFHAVAMVNFWYWSVFWLDMVMHFIGGFWVALLFFWLRQKRRFTQISTQINADEKINFNLENNQRKSALSLRESALWTIVSCLSFVALIAVFWEFFEFLYDVFISSKGYFEIAQQGVADTISDLFFGLLGGLIAAILNLRNRIT